MLQNVETKNKTQQSATIPSVSVRVGVTPLKNFHFLHSKFIIYGIWKVMVKTHSIPSGNSSMNERFIFSSWLLIIALFDVNVDLIVIS
jgi:hypothetical protein